MSRAGAHTQRVTYGELFAVPAYRALFSSTTLSLLGDRAATIALMVLVFERSQSTLLTAAIYAVAYLPYLWAAPLAALADRYPRRSVMILCNLARALLVLTMALPELPIGALFALMLAVATFEPLSNAALTAGTADVLDERQLAAGTTLYGTASQLAQVGGYMVGGATIAALSTTGCLILDGVTFVVSAALIWRHMPSIRTPLTAGENGQQTALRAVRAAGRLIWRSPRLRRLCLVMWVLPVAVVVPEGLAVPYAHSAGAGALGTGLLIAAVPLGAAVGGILVGRILRPSLRDAALRPLVLMSGVPLILAAVAVPGSVKTTLLWILAGTGGAGFMLALGQFVVAVPADQRATAHGLLSTGVMAAQGVSMLAAGALAEDLPPSIVVGLAGATSVVLALIMGSARAPSLYRSTAPDLTEDGAYT
jgi:MFS family permease